MAEQGWEPARRFVIAQSWWIASELCRRHPERRIYEMHPGGGMYDVLAVIDPVDPLGDATVSLNRAGRIHVTGTPDLDAITWDRVLGSEDPHEIVREIEQRKRWGSPSPAPATTPTTLVYRVIARLLAIGVDDRQRWDARNSVLDTSGYGGDEPRYLNAFPAVREHGAHVRYDVGARPELSRYWAVTRERAGKVPDAVLLFDEAGWAFARDGRALELMPRYERDHKLGALVTELVSEFVA